MFAAVDLPGPRRRGGRGFLLGNHRNYAKVSTLAVWRKNSAAARQGSSYAERWGKSLQLNGMVYDQYHPRARSWKNGSHTRSTTFAGGFGTRRTHHTDSAYCAGAINDAHGLGSTIRNNCKLNGGGSIETLRPIKAGEEIFYSYHSHYWGNRRSLLRQKSSSVKRCSTTLQPSYEVHSILDYNHANRHLLVHWKGHKRAESTWEPLCNFINNVHLHQFAQSARGAAVRQHLHK